VAEPEVPGRRELRHHPGGRLAEHLLENQGIALNGVILISAVLDFATIRFGEGTRRPTRSFCRPTRRPPTTTRSSKPELQADLPKALKAAERFALNDYSVALAKGRPCRRTRGRPWPRNWPAHRAAAETVLKANLRVDPDLFRKALLVDQEKGRRPVRRPAGRVRPRPARPRPGPRPELPPVLRRVRRAFNDYARRGLKYESDVQYDVLTGRVQPWNFGREGTGT
jgi:carboxypeptidase C (cathepsin A)